MSSAVLADVLRISGAGIAVVGLLIALPGVTDRLRAALGPRRPDVDDVFEPDERPVVVHDVAVIGDHPIEAPPGRTALPEALWRERHTAWTAEHLESLRQRVSLLEEEVAAGGGDRSAVLAELEAALHRQIARVRTVADEAERRPRDLGVTGFPLAATGIVFIGLGEELARLPWWAGAGLVTGAVFWALWSLVGALVDPVPGRPLD